MDGVVFFVFGTLRTVLYFLFLELYGRCCIFCFWNSMDGVVFFCFWNSMDGVVFLVFGTLWTVLYF